MKQCRGQRVDGKGWVYGWYFEYKGKAYIIPTESRILPLGYTDGPPCLDGFIEVIGNTIDDKKCLEQDHE